MASSQDSEWSPDWTPSEMWTLKELPTQQGRLMNKTQSRPNVPTPLAPGRWCFCTRPCLESRRSGAQTFGAPPLRHPHREIWPDKIMEEAEMVANKAVRGEMWKNPIDYLDCFYIHHSCWPPIFFKHTICFENYKEKTRALWFITWWLQISLRHI